MQHNLLCLGVLFACYFVVSLNENVPGCGVLNPKIKNEKYSSQVDQTFLIEQLNVGRDLYGDLENAAISPYLLSFGIGMLKTAMTEEDKCMSNVLSSEKVFNAGSKFYGKNNSNIILANYVIKDPRVKYRTKYRNLLKQLGVQKYDIMPTKIDKLVGMINQQVDKDTRGLIPQIASGDMFGQDTMFVLLNTLYFKADWETPFNKEVNGTFHDGPNDVTTTFLVKDIESDDNAIYGDESSSVYGLYKLPYKGGQISMIVVLPKSNVTLNSIKHEDVVKSMESLEETSYYTVEMPKIEHAANLDVLKTRAGKCLGLAKYGNVFESCDGVKLGSFIHKTKLMTSLTGTEAAAANVVSITNLLGITEDDILRFDRAFLYFIHDSQTNAILFYGTYNGPEK